MLDGAGGAALWRDWKHDLEARLVGAEAELAGRRARVAMLDAENGRLVEALADGLASSGSVRDRLLANEAEIERLRGRIAADRALPPVSALDRRRFRSRLKRAAADEDVAAFLSRVLVSVTVRQGARDPLAVTAVAPNFTTLAALAGDPAGDPTDEAEPGDPK